VSVGQNQSVSSLSDQSPPDRDNILEHDPTLAELVVWLVAAYQPRLVYLFGSLARGEAGPDGDYDLLLVVSDTAPPERCDSDLAYRVLGGTGVDADVVVWTRSRFERRQHVVASLPATVVRKGRLLHAA
jgi:uncharacterized protein